ncbi:MAG: hypothetical protein ACTHW2_08140 [Tissierella sp.]|uniref:hypothetical protein n=1 Tax=Tissierella sp. TaxID=41274 RepID=UPI003F997E4A
MLKLDLEKLLLNIFQQDKMKSNKHTIFSQISMITIKSLIPSPENVGNFIDYNRFKEELKLLKLYKIEDKKHELINIKENVYFKYKDETIYARLIPIIISNKDYEIIEREVVKNILYTTGDIEVLLEWMFISKLIFLMIEENDNTLGELKEYIINLSQTGFLEKYGDKYLYDYLKPDLNFEVKFERVKVSIISLLHGIDMGKFKYLKDLLDIVDGKNAETMIGFIVEKSKLEEKVLYDIDKSYERMASYILKLRKSRIDPSDLKIKKYILPDIFSFKEGEMFFHSLLNNSRVIKKEVQENSLTSLVETRAGIYLFKRDPLN